MRKVFTVGQVAQICKVAPQTVSKWFDSGRLRGYRIPGSQDRRIPREHLIQFLKEHGMPLAELEEEDINKVLLVGLPEEWVANALREHLPIAEGFKIEVVTSGFEAGLKIESIHPDCIIVDALQIGRNEAIRFGTSLRSKPEFSNTIVIGLIGITHEPRDFEMADFNELCRKPFDVALLADRIRRLLAERKATA